MRTGSAVQFCTDLSGRYLEAARSLLRKTGASLTQTTAEKAEVLPFDATSEEAHPSCLRPAFSPGDLVQILHGRRLHETKVKPRKAKKTKCP